MFDFRGELRYAGSMRIHPAGIVVAFGVAPLIWAACGGPPEAAAPGGSGSGEASGTAVVVATVEPQGSGSAAAGEDPKPKGADTGFVEAMPPDMEPKGPPMSKANCEALKKKTDAAMDSAEAGAKACATDADCVVVMDGYCMRGGCGDGIAKAKEAGYRQSLKAITEPACSAWYAGGCPTKVPVAMPSCAMAMPTCSAGRCAAHF